jgi:hypothetical protein
MINRQIFFDFSYKIKTLIPKHYKDKDEFIKNIYSIENEMMECSEELVSSKWLKLLKISMEYLEQFECKQKN